MPRIRRGRNTHTREYDLEALPLDTLYEMQHHAYQEAFFTSLGDEDLDMADYFQQQYSRLTVIIKRKQQERIYGNAFKQ